MTSLLLKFEAVESRIASYSVPRGTNGRVHALRLRRFFSRSGRCPPEAAAITRQLAPADGSHCDLDANVTGTYHGEGSWKRKGSWEKQLDESQLELGLEVRRPQHDELFKQRETETAYNRRLGGFRKVWSWSSLPKAARQSLLNVSHQDILPYQFPDGVSVECSPDATALYHALRMGSPHNVLKETMRLIRFDGFNYHSKVLQTIPVTTFTEILRCLDPQYFVGRYAKLHMEISPAYGKVLGMPVVNKSGSHPFFKVFLSQIHGIMKARQRDYPLSISDYKFLLRCAKLTANTRLAKEVWVAMTKWSKTGAAEQVTPDGECYNLYLATMTWSDLRNPLLKNRLRVIPDNMNARSWKAPPYRLQGHRVGSDNGIKLHVAQIFHHMVKAGLHGDEETFCLMMMAFAREGDLHSVRSSLQRVWGLNVEAIVKATDQAEPLPVKQYSVDSPFYPTSKLLHTIAHGYGINNDLPTALRLVDYVSRYYKVAIPLSVWNELLQWTYVLSAKRYGQRVEKDGTNIGGLPPEAVSNIWATMIGKPYNVRPSMEMYDKHISNLLRRQRFGSMQEVMQQARQKQAYAVKQLSRAQILARSTLQEDQPVSEKRMRDLQFLKARVARNREYIRKWVRHLIKHGSMSLRRNLDFTARRLPSIVKDWNRWLPRRVDYLIPTGHVRFRTHMEVNNAMIRHTWTNTLHSRHKSFKRGVKKIFKHRDNRGGLSNWEHRRGFGIVNDE